MLTRISKLSVVIAALLCGSLAMAEGGQEWVPKHDAGALHGNWAGTWATAPQLPGPFDGPFAIPSEQTLRQIVRISHGGSVFRIRVSNTFGTTPLTISAASVGISVGGAAVEDSSIRTLTFGGAQSIEVAAGARAFSDAVKLSVADLQSLAISLYVADGGADPASPVTGHVHAFQTNYVMSGNQVEQADPIYDATFTTSNYLTGVDVLVTKPTPVIAFVGDSITDGTGSTPDANKRYPDLVAERIFGHNKRRKRGLNRAGVLNLGIAGNQAVTSLIGPSLQARLDRDVLTQSGVTHAVVLIGINDIGLPAFANSIGIPIPLISADQVIAAHKQIIARIKARGLKAIGATLTPAGNFVLPDYNQAVGEAKRQAVNAWIRTSGAYDVVFDFDKVLRDPADETVMRADLSADGLHPNDAGYAVMARAVRLHKLKTNRRRK